MKRMATFFAVALLGLRAFAALPTLSEIAARLENIGNRYEETTNALANVRKDLETARTTVSNLVVLIEKRRDLREDFHGGRVTSYIITNGLQIVRLDAYADGSFFTNLPTRVSLADPEAAAKARAEAEARIAAWEREHLPAEIADLLQRRRDAANGKAGEENE